MSLLTAPVFKNSQFFTEIYFISLKKQPRSNFKGFQYQVSLDLSEKIEKVFVK